MRASIAAIVIAAALTFATCARAQVCSTGADIYFTREQSIKACTAALHNRTGTVSLPFGTINSQHAEGRATIYYTRGLLYQLTGHPDLAVQDYTDAVTLMDDYGDAYAARGDAYENLSQNAKAEDDYTKAANFVDTWDNLNGRCWERAIRGYPFDRALSDCNEALKQKTDDPDIWDTRCFLYYRMGNYAAAISDCDAAIKLQRRDDTSLYMRGLAKLKAGDKAGGNADIAAAKDINYKIAKIYAVYGVGP